MSSTSYIEEPATKKIDDVYSSNVESDHYQTFNENEIVLAHSTSKSIGVRKAELLTLQYQAWWLRVILFFFIFCASYCYSLDGTIRGSLQAYATASYAQHSLLSTVNVIKAVTAAASQPTYARLSDRFGRLELMIFSLVLYACGTVIESQAYDVNRFAGGAVLYQIGYSGIIVMFQIILADFSTLNWRLVASFVPALPFIINTWISAEALDSLYPAHSWNYGIGIWAFIFPLTCVPVLACYLHMWLGARKTPEWAAILRDEKEQHPIWISWKKNIFIDLFWELDVIGILFIICVFGFILVPFTIAQGVSDKWSKASTIAPLVVGFALLPCFVYWEAKWAKYPITPFPLLKDRGVWSALLIACFIDWIWYMPNDFMYTVLMVAMNQSQKAALRITSLYSFVSVIVGPLLGFIIVYARKTKPFILFGISTWMVSLGLMVHYRGDNDGINDTTFVNGIIGALCLMGFGAGLFTYTTQVSIATCTNHEHMAVVIALYLASYNIGLAIGASVSGAVWTNLMFKQISKEIEKAGLDPTVSVLAYTAPIGIGGFIEKYTWGTPERIAVVAAYAHVQKILCIIGLVLCVPMIIASFFLRNHKLETVQSLEFSKGITHPDSEKAVVVNNEDNDPIYDAISKLFFWKQKN